MPDAVRRRPASPRTLADVAAARVTAPPEGLGTRVVRGTASLVVAQLGSHGLRLVSNVILTRLIAPEAFGLMGIIVAVTTGLQLVSDIGLRQALVRSPRGDERVFLDTAWTLGIVRGLLLCVVGCAAAWPAARFYDEPALLWLLPLTAIQAVLQAFESTNTTLATRRLHVGRVVVMELLSQVVGLCIAVPMAWATHSVVALVGAALGSALARTLMSHVFLPGGRNRFAWEERTRREIYSFGGWIMVSTFLFFLGTRWDVFALGRFEGMAMLGVYAIAQMITVVPVQISGRVVGSVLLPALSEEYRAAADKFAGTLSRARAVLLPAGGVLFLGAAATAPAFCRVLYREEYRDAGWMTQLLVVAAWCSFLQESSARALAALGDSKGIAAANLARLVFTAGFTWIGFEVGSLVGFIIANACGAFVGTIAAAIALRRHGVHLVIEDALATAVFLATGALACGTPILVEGIVGAPFAVPVEYLTLGTGAVVLAPAALVVLRRTRAAMRSRVAAP